MPAVIVVVPATALLVRGAAGPSDPLADVRAAVHGALGGVFATGFEGDQVAVLGVGFAARAGRLRPSLGAAGIADSVSPLLGRSPADEQGDPEAAWDGIASVGASVALLAAWEAVPGLVHRPIDVVEVPSEAPQAVVLAAAERLREVGLVVVADHPAPGVDAGVNEWTSVGHWYWETTEFAKEHEHLAASYWVKVARPR
jgi:hypothetical protein